MPRRKNTEKVDVTAPGTSPAVTPQIELSPEEIQAVIEARKRIAQPAISAPATDTEAQQSLANALIQAIEATRPPTKKTVFNRKKGTPWTPPDGVPKVKLNRVYMHHGIEIDPEKHTNAELEALNKVKPGVFCKGHIRVNKRRDGAYDIDYPIRTASQRMKLSSEFGITANPALGITGFQALCDRLSSEYADQKRRRAQGLEDDEPDNN